MALPDPKLGRKRGLPRRQRRGMADLREERAPFLRPMELALSDDAEVRVTRMLARNIHEWDVVNN